MNSIEWYYRYNEIFCVDMNEDGNNDIVFQSNDTGFNVLLNDGQGNISAQINNVAATGTLVGADLKEIADVDGDMDGIFWAKTTQYRGYSVIGYNNGTGVFSNYNDLDNDTFFLSIVETGDIDGDGDLDILCAGHRYINTATGIEAFVWFYKNNGSNNYTLREEIDLPVLSNVSDLHHTKINIEDINSDGTDELMVEYSFEDNCDGSGHNPICDKFNYFQVMDYNIQSEAFVTLEHYNSWLHGYYYNLFNRTFHIQFGQQNRDNNLDILSVNVPQGKLHWYLGDGSGGFNNTQVVNFNSQYSSSVPYLRVADIDNDTDLDIFVLGSTLTLFKNLALTPSCSSVLDLANTSLTDGIYQAGTTIISSGNVVAGNNNVVLKAGYNVKLQSGFKAPSNSRVKIRISFCN